MGEITDALRRAKLERQTRRDAEHRREAVPAEVQNTVVRAGIDAPPSISRPAPDPPSMPIAEPIRLRDEPGSDNDFAEISQERNGTWPARAVLLDPRKPHTERFRRFAVRVRQELDQRGAKTALITSALRSEGKTFTACNLALALSSMLAGGRIALLELDTRRPAISPSLGVEPRVGIETVLAGEVPLRTARTPTDLPSLDLYLIRRPPPSPHELLTGGALPGIFRELEQRYDIIIVDSPPILVVPDVSLLLAHVGACVAVVRAGSSRVKAAREMLEQISGDKLLGVFVNDLGTPRGSDQYGYYSAEDDSR